MKFFLAAKLSGHLSQLIDLADIQKDETALGKPVLNSDRSKKLIQEAIQLTDVISKLDKKREADLVREHGKLAVWWDRNIESDPTTSFVADKAIGFAKDKAGFTTVTDVAEEGLKTIIINVIRLTGVAVSKTAEKGIGVAASILLSSRDTGGLNGQYLDDGRGSELEAKKLRLAQIYSELFAMDPPLKPLFEPDICKIEACMRAR